MDFKANVKFLEGVVETAKLERDPIEAMSKHMKSMMNRLGDRGSDSE